MITKLELKKVEMKEIIEITTEKQLEQLERKRN